MFVVAACPAGKGRQGSSVQPRIFFPTKITCYTVDHNVCHTSKVHVLLDSLLTLYTVRRDRGALR